MEISFEDLAERFELKGYPDEYPGLFDKLKAEGTLFNTDLFDETAMDICRKYDVFGEYEKEIREAAARALNDPGLLALAQVERAYIELEPENSLRLKKNKFPKPVSPETRLFGYFLLLEMLPGAIGRYRKRGFEEEMIEKLPKHYPGSLKVCSERLGYPGIDVVYLWWIGSYAAGKLFDFEGFNFEIKEKWPENTVVLKNKKSGELKAFLVGTKVHRSGRIFGTVGCTDGEGSFTTTFDENETEFEGFPAVGMKIDPGKKCYPKAEWEKVLEKGDCVIGFHIPQKKSIKTELVEQAFADVKLMIKEHYPEISPRAFTIGSWLVDTQYRDILPETSNIVNFQKLWTVYPSKSDGYAPFGYVFPKIYDSIENLPEDTTLRRKLKEIYLSGGYAYSGRGVRLF